MGVSVASEIKPLTCHVFSVSGAVHESVDQAVVSRGRCILQEGIDLFRGRWQSGQIQCHATDECFLVRWPGGKQSSLLQTRIDKGIHGIIHMVHTRH